MPIKKMFMIVIMKKGTVLIGKELWIEAYSKEGVREIITEIINQDRWEVEKIEEIV